MEEPALLDFEEEPATNRVAILPVSKNADSATIFIANQSSERCRPSRKFIA